MEPWYKVAMSRKDAESCCSGRRSCTNAALSLWDSSGRSESNWRKARLKEVGQAPVARE